MITLRITKSKAEEILSKYTCILHSDQERINRLENIFSRKEQEAVCVRLVEDDEENDDGTII